MSTVLAVVDDLLFVSKLQETARQLTASVTIVRAADFRLENCHPQRLGLVIVDLNAASANPLELIRQLKNDPDCKRIPLVAFFSHVQVELQRAAQEAGCDQVLPRSKFTAILSQLLRQFTPAGEERPATRSTRNP